ncbi:unnamed protein product [Prunus armeniaca]|uniref:Uncharacterized protein n=1 Tax=Prunus armeniaca TaxID=36596 RepID=A0A6J5UAY8_PRUAR|nr:unnamed protein product [Prunus armeniaca]CAB4303972.1 unnamed protein product [Prunus armeniaca]
MALENIQIYERARILGTPAVQSSMNGPVMVELQGETDSLESDCSALPTGYDKDERVMAQWPLHW